MPVLLLFGSSRRYWVRIGMAWMTAGRAVHHHQFQQVSGPVRAEHQPARRVVTHLLDNDRVVDGVEDVLARDAMAQRRAENLHPGIVLRNYRAPAGKPPGDR